MVTYHLALEADDVFFGSVRSVKFFQILMNTAYQIRMVSFESPCRVQHILDGLLQPCAVCLVRKCLLHFLNDGGNLFGQQFLFNGRYGCRALVTESIGILIKEISSAGYEFLDNFEMTVQGYIYQVTELFRRFVKKACAFFKG